MSKAATIASKPVILCVAALVLGTVSLVWAQPTVSLSEFRIDQPSTDNDEYFELSGPAGTSLTGLTYLVIGDGTAGSGVIEAVIDLTGQSIGAGGFFVAAEATFSLGSADLTADLNFENSDNVTHLLVEGFTGSDGDDLDTDDDGVLDATPWSQVEDCVALIETVGSGEQVYCATQVGPDGSFVPGHVFVCPSGWSIGAFDPSAGQDTPGAANVCGVSGEGLIINEIMQNPSVVFDSSGEWFEVFNSTSSAIDINGWTIQDNDFDSHVIVNGGPLVVPAGGFLVLGNNADSATNGGVGVDYQYSADFFLANSADELVLLDLGMTEIDRVEWDGGPTFPDPNGASMSLIDPTLDNNVGANWCTATTPFGAGDLGTPGEVNDCPVVPPFGACGDPAIFIHDVQGSGPASPLDGTPGVVLEGVVVGDFEDTTTELRGFFLQEEDADADADPATSEGIFVFNNGFGPGVSVGDRVRVEGTVDEFFDLTELAGVTNLSVCASGITLPTAATVTLPVASLDAWESVEGMLVALPQTLYVTDNFNQGRFGEVELSVGAPLDYPTNVASPGAPALALQDLNSRSRIQLDDGSNLQNPLPLPPYLGLENTLRVGDSLPSLTAVLSYAFGAYELHPVEPVSFSRLNERPDPPSVGGALRVAPVNVLNYFTTLDNAGPICGPAGVQDCRGADTPEEFIRQRDKLVAAITGLDADVVGVIEIENHPGDVPIADLVDGLNDVAGPGTYDYIPTGAMGTDAIRCGLIYQPAAVTPAGPYAVLDSSVDPRFLDTDNRPVLAQSFQENSSGAIFTVAVNHLRSKGSSCEDVGDPDAGDGQGNCNGVRTAAAEALVDWLATDPTGTGSSDFLIVGDLNAYAEEDPVTTIEAAGYIDLIQAFVGMGVADGAYTFDFFGELGYLDHALSSSSMMANVTGTAIWHINANEPRALDYNDFNQPLLYQPDEFRSSDHDPVVVGLFGDSDEDGVLDVVDVCPDTAIPESVPTLRLRVNSWALVDGDGIFDTTSPYGRGSGPSLGFTIEQTGGCSCEQIIDALGLGRGHEKFGCSTSAMRTWVNLVNP